MYWLVVWDIFIFPYIGNLIIPTDFYIFRGVGQSPNSIYTYIIYIYIGYRFVVSSALLIKHSHSMINIRGITQFFFDDEMCE